MSQNYSGRVSLILFVLVAALVATFWPSVASPLKVGLNGAVPVSQKLNLKPGIDIVGGTSLLYEIKTPEGGNTSATLAEDVTKALKRRVDPNGVRNLIWRPQNPNKLEIQMPLTGSSAESAARQKALEEARARLEATNVRVPDAMAWVEQGAARNPADLDRLAAGSPQRKKVLQDLAATHDQVKAFEAAKDPAKIEEHNAADARHKALQAELAATNLPAAELERRLTARDPKSRDKSLADLKAQSAAFPERVAAVDAFAAARAALAAGGGGLESAADLKRLLRGSGVLEFHIVPQVNDPGLTDAAHPRGYEDWVKQLQAFGPRGNAGDNYRWFEVDNGDEFKGRTAVFDERHWLLASVKKEDSLDRNSGEWKLANAHETGNNMGQRVVGFDFDTFGGVLFGELTKRHVNQEMAIMLDGRVISAPNINEPITQGRGTISGGGGGGFSAKELGYLITMLSAGSLPAQLNEEPISERTVGPQLGEDNLRRGLLACGLGLVVVAVFLVGYYYLAGLVAFVAVVLNLVIILGAMAAINATFTLPGIAAIVLTVGSAVDANVLIFERLREEQHRGLPVRSAVRNAYDRAFSAILDSNMTTLITSFFLVAFGTEEVKGFGITLIIGVVASLFTSLFVTKTIFGLLIDVAGVRRLGSLPLSVPRWDEMLRPNIRWTRLVGPFAAASVAFIVVGCVLFGRYAAQGRVLDIEFASGTAVTFDVREPATLEQVRGWIDAEERRSANALPSPGVQRIGTDGRTWEVTTPNEDAVAVRAAVERAVGDHLNAERRSTFVGVDKRLADVRFAGATPPAGNPATAPAAATGPASQPAGDVVVVPLTPENLADRSLWPNGVVPDEAKRFVGGAAIVLRQLDPPIAPQDVAARINRQKLQPQAGAATRGLAADFTVVGVGAGPAAPAATALLLTADPSRDYRKNEAAWRAEVVEPLWELANQAIASPPKLQQVRNFNASVAGETQKDATVALVLSILFIVAYIWVRFGNLKYGTATVVALVHDVAFCFAALGFAQFLSGNAVGDLLLLQPFRINLTIVAGILTVMSFSMLDTIVVFDRIRELRGKYGHVSPTVINDAINQTLSRTLLTAGTTLVSLLIMYVIGGEGVHGFTFVLLVGILAGTYSSIAIASPILLVGGRASEEAAAGPPRAAATT